MNVLFCKIALNTLEVLMFVQYNTIAFRINWGDRKCSSTAAHLKAGWQFVESPGDLSLGDALLHRKHAPIGSYNDLSPVRCQIIIAELVMVLCQSGNSRKKNNWKSHLQKWQAFCSGLSVSISWGLGSWVPTRVYTWMFDTVFNNCLYHDVL